MAVEELPYLEILCVPDAAGSTSQSPAAEEGAQVEDEGGLSKIPQSYEKQGSLIALAWSKPPEEDTDDEAEEDEGQSQEASLKSQILPCDAAGERSTADLLQTDSVPAESVRQVLHKSETVDRHYLSYLPSSDFFSSFSILNR